MLAITSFILTKGLDDTAQILIKEILRIDIKDIRLTGMQIIVYYKRTYSYVYFIWSPESSMITNSIAMAGGILLFVIPYGKRERILG